LSYIGRQDETLLTADKFLAPLPLRLILIRFITINRISHLPDRFNQPMIRKY